MKKLNFFKVVKSGKFAVECILNGIISKKCLPRSNYEVFLAKNQRTLNVRKIRNYDGERVFFQETKRFHLFKNLPYKNGKAQNMPVVASRLVCFIVHN